MTSVNVTKIEDWLNDAAQLECQASELSERARKLQAMAKKDCPHPASRCDTTQNEDEYGKKLPPSYVFTCVICSTVLETKPR